MEPTDLEIGLLGPVRLVAALPERPLASGTQRALIAVLALAGGRVTSYGEAIWAVWQEDASGRRVHNLHFHMSKLRGQLRDIEPGRPLSRIVTLPSGYRLDLAGSHADWREFSDLTDRARAIGDHGDLPGAARLYEAALSLWRGPALADVAAMSSWLGAQAARLEEQRLVALEEQAEIGLAAGRHHEITADLAWLTQQNGPRQRLTGLLMIALYRSGRQSEALAAYASYRAELAERFGLDPPPELEDLHRKILAGDPCLAIRADAG